MHALTKEIPEYLRPYVASQDASLYTPIDHASWRYILKISQAFFAEHAHQKYLDGLRETGISVDRIPLIEEMDQKLRRFNWRAVAVSGFIPPAVFMEFLSLGILPIACDMRKIENLAYTPAPDIVHEAAGHAPIIADPNFAAYLRSYGLVAEKAIYSRQDLEVYEAVRNLSIVKEDPASTDESVRAAQARLDQALLRIDHVSEATQLSRMGWWTFEYGLIGDIRNPKIYGAGLLSSVGESYHCLGSEVKKIPFSMDCVEMNFDITRPQPQLYVAPDFQTLTRALDDLGDRMAFRRGGGESLDKAKKAEAVTTSVLDSGIQVSGVLSNWLRDSKGEPSYLQFVGLTQLSHGGVELEGQGPEYHKSGFGTPVGLLKGTRKSPAELTEPEVRVGRLEFESGVIVEGRYVASVRRDGKNLILIFENCTVRKGADILFKPEWGKFDMACGTRVISVFGHAADRKRYLMASGGFKQEPGKQKTNLTRENRELNEIYARVRKIRSEGRPSAVSLQELARIASKLEQAHPKDWLLRYELLELAAQYKFDASWVPKVRSDLERISDANPDKREMIGRGLSLL